MTKLAKLIQKIRSNPRDVRFEDACKVANRIRFVGGPARGGGSHTVFHHPENGGLGLNFQNRDGKIPAYQARQLIKAIDTYHDPDGDEND